jgi:hypothetical protein
VAPTSGTAMKFKKRPERKKIKLPDPVPEEFYRYEWDNIHKKIKLIKFELKSETTAGYWIQEHCIESMFGPLRFEEKRWIPKRSRKRFAYPSKEEAIKNFFMRRKSYREHVVLRMKGADHSLREGKILADELGVEVPHIHDYKYQSGIGAILV